MDALLGIFWNQLGNPWFWVITIISFTVIFFLFRKVLKIIPFIALVLFGIVLGSMLPSLILEYHHEYAGGIVRMKGSIKTVQTEDPTSPALIKLEESFEKSKLVLDKFDNAEGWEMYEVFFSNIEREIYVSTLERYSPTIVLNRYGFIGIIIGAVFGAFLWALIKVFLWINHRSKKNRS